MLTARGGVETDVTVSLVEPGCYYVVSAAATETHDLGWLQLQAPDDGSVRIDTVTARYGVPTVAGPRSRELLQPVSGDDFSNEGFRFFTCRPVDLGRARAPAFRLPYAGEARWEIPPPRPLRGTTGCPLRTCGHLLSPTFRLVRSTCTRKPSK